MDSKECGDPNQERLERDAMPWIGLYITAASALCTLAMAADAFNALRRRKLWFPCKYFSLNATSLTLLAIAMKLPTDLTTDMAHIRIAKFTSLVFMSTAMANFISSLGSTTDRHILSNVVALGILIATITADVLIRMVVLNFINLFLFPTALMLLLLAILISLAITVPATKQSLESSYQEQHKEALKEEVSLDRKIVFKTDDQRDYMMKYWVMAESSSPQFVIARSAVCSTSSVLSSVAFLAVVGARLIRWTRLSGPSPYGWSTRWIIYVQTSGVAVGTIAPLLRWFVVVSFKCLTANTTGVKERIKIENYWIQTLVDWRDSFSALGRIQQNNRFTKYLHDLKWFALTVCIRVQIFIVLLSKLFVFLSVLFMSPFFLCFNHLKKYIRNQSGGGGDLDDNDMITFSRYVLLLEGEAELPPSILKNICGEADHIIETGRKKQPESLLNLLGKFVDFSGVGLFDSYQIPSLHSQEPQNCWTLPLVTLTSIAIALPNIAKHKRNHLLGGVNEGLYFAKLVQKVLVKKDQLVNVKKAADICWVGVVLYMKWLEIDLIKTYVDCKNSKEVLLKLADKAEEMIMEFKKEVRADSVMEDPVNWSDRVVAANSMYRISRTILLYCGEQTDEGLFERLCAMIADVLAACLTNLPHVITTMCHCNAIEEREKSVGKAFLLLGKTEGMLRILQQKEWPFLDHDKAACVDEWRDLFWKNKDDVAASLISNASDETGSSSDPVSIVEERLCIKVNSC